MATKRISLKLSSKTSVKKDLFGVVDKEKDDSKINTEQSIKSPLDSIWGESNSYSFTQPVTNSILLSPALKRTPNRFSTSPRQKKSGDTPNKSTTPRKLSKYSPFRKKVHKPDPRDSIKNFFRVKEQSSYKDSEMSSLGIERLRDSVPSTSVSNTQSQWSTEEPCRKPVSQIDSNEEDTNSTSGRKPQESTPAKYSTNVTPLKNNSSTPQSANKSLSPMSKITGKNDVYGRFLLSILNEIVCNDSDPNNTKLCSEEDFELIKAFNQFDQPSQRLYGRLLNRKIDWIRVASMKYGDVHLQLMFMEQNGFISSNYGEESLETLLNLLNVPELKELGKSYKLPATANKPELIAKLISRAKQPSIKSYFIKSSEVSDGENNIRAKIYDFLGLTIKVTSEPRQMFSRCLLFFSYPHFRGLEKDRFSNELALFSNFNNFTFPSYEIYRTSVFSSREQFLVYEAALIECSNLSEAKELKNWDLAVQRLRLIVERLQSLLANEEIRRELEGMPDFLRRFTACGCYMRGVGGSVDVFKKTQSLLEAEASLELLLGQRLVGRHRRGQWYEQLALLYQHNLKDNGKAAEVVLRGLRDEYIDMVSRHCLSARAAMLEGRKTNALRLDLRNALVRQRNLFEPLEEPTSITITEQVLDNHRPGLKQVYVQDSVDGKMLSSVEEVAREHFRQEGYTYGEHDEGGLIKSLVFSCFWNEIYGIHIAEGHGLFHSVFQTVPLDWNSESFYQRRREEIKKKLQDFVEGGIETVITTFKDCFITNFAKESVVNWKYFEHSDVESFIRCLDIDLFLKLARLLLKKHRFFSAGFPDLTLWDPEKKQCVFVEVKSPNDQLSMKQRVWLHSLMKMGANAIVCHVQSVGCKSQKRKAE